MRNNKGLTAGDRLPQTMSMGELCVLLSVDQHEDVRSLLRGSKRRLERPEVHLVAACLAEGISTFLKYIGHPIQKSHQPVKEYKAWLVAKAWIEDKISDSPFSFVWCCDHINILTDTSLKAPVVRARLLKILANGGDGAVVEGQKKREWA